MFGKRLFAPEFNQIRKKNTETTPRENDLLCICSKFGILEVGKNKVTEFVLTKPTSAISILFSTFIQ